MKTTARKIKIKTAKPNFLVGFMAPHFGQNFAVVLTSMPQSLHLTRAINIYLHATNYWYQSGFATA